MLRAPRRAGSLIRCALAVTLLAGVVPVLGPAAPASAATLEPGPLSGAAVGAPSLGAAVPAVPADAVVVAPWGDDAAAGTAAAPYLTLTQAVAQVADGGTIALRGGTYRESVQVYRKRVTIQAWPGEGVWIDGSDVVTGFVGDGDDWRLDGWVGAGTVASPGQTHLVDAANPAAGHPDEVFVDGVARRQVLTRGEVGPGTFYVDRANQRLYVGDDPNGRTVAATRREWGIYFNGADGSRLLGVGVRRHATSLDKVAAVRVYADDVLVEGVVVEDNALNGISVMGADAVITRSTFRRNGQLGVHGLNADGLTVSYSTISANNDAGFSKESAAGLKLTSTRFPVLTANEVQGNGGPGLWVDISSYQATVTRNLVVGNARSGIQIELTGHAVVAGNAVTDSGEAGIWVVDSNDVAVWNNTVLRNVRGIDVVDGPRNSSDTSSPNHDERFPIPNPQITWVTQRVTVRNNVFGPVTGGANSAFRVDSVAHDRNAWDMATSDANAYYRPSGASPPWLVLWSNWPTGPVTANDLGQAWARTGQEQHSVAVDGGANPYVTDEGTRDFRTPAGVTTGASLPGSIAAALGRSGIVPMGVLEGPGAAPTGTGPGGSGTGGGGGGGGGRTLGTGAWPRGVIGSAGPMIVEGGQAVPLSTGDLDPRSVVAAARTPDGGGWWVATAAGDVAPQGAAPALGSLSGLPLSSAVLEMTGTPTGQGYWLLAGDGGVFSFGDAAFHGSTGAMVLSQPVVSMAPTPSNGGYWLVARDGGVFSFGDAQFHGSTGDISLNQPIVSMAATSSGGGYWLVARDGGVFCFGDAQFHGSIAEQGRSDVVGMFGTPSGGGYWIVTADGQVFPFGDAG